MTPTEGLSAAEVLAYLDRAAAGRTPARHDAMTWSAEALGYREAAAVLVAIENPGELRAVGPSGASGAAAELLGSELVPATGRKLSGQVMLAPDVRAEVIGKLVQERRVEEALAANPAERGSALQKHLERYLHGDASPLERQSLEELESTRQVVLWLSGGLPGLPTQAEVDARAALLRLLAPLETIAGDAVFRGRARELDELRGYIGVLPPERMLARVRGLFRWARPRRQPAVSISGPGGVGKSALVARFMIEHTRLSEDARVPFGYLDFERDDLDVGDPLALCVELLRQLDLQFPGDDRFADLRGRGRRSWDERDRITPDQKLGVARSLLADVLQRIDTQLGPRPYVVVLDTFEIVQYRGEARAIPLWDMLRELQTTAPFLRVVVAGRAPVESLRLGERPTNTIALDALDAESAAAFLRTQGISDSAVCARIVEIFGRMPLSLKLAASLAAREPGGAGALLDAGRSLVRMSDDVLQSVLFDRILNHVADERVRRVAHPGLVLRRINPKVILEVLNEPCALALANLAEARALFTEVERETSLVSVDNADGDLVHRSDLRRIMLRMLTTSAPAQIGDIRRRAVRFYSGDSGRRARAEEFYHRLHLGEKVDSRSLLSSEVRASIQAGVEEFPLPVQLHLAGIGFDVPDHVRAHASQAVHEEGLAARIEELLSYGPSGEADAEELYEHARVGGLRPASALHRSGARIAAQRGDNDAAAARLAQGFEEATRGAQAIETLRLLQEQVWLDRRQPSADQADGLARLEERARRYRDISALVQCRAQLFGIGRPDLGPLTDLLKQAEPQHVWDLVPALAPVVDRARQWGDRPLLELLQMHVQEDPFPSVVFPDRKAQAALDDVLLGAGEVGPIPFAEWFLQLCDAWPYRILFVQPPFGRRGEHLAESLL